MRPATQDAVIGIVVAAIVGVLINVSLLRAVLFQNELAWNDSVQESSDEYFYLTRIREVTDGHPDIGNPYIYELRDQSYPLGSLWENILSLPMRLFGWSIKTVSLLGDAFLPFLCALLTWFAFRNIVPDKRWRALAIGMIFLGTQVTLWKRPVNPQATTIFPLLWIWLYLSPSRSSVTSMIMRSGLIGLMTYSYPFHWTYCAVAEALLWMSRREFTKKSLMDAAFLACPFLIVALPWIIGTLTIAHDPTYQETTTRLGLIERHLPAGPVFQLELLFGIALVLAATWKRQSTVRMPLLALLCAGIVVLWSPLLTGKEAEFANHYGRLLLFPISLSVVFGISNLTKQSKIATWGALGLMSVSLLSSTLNTTIDHQKFFNETRLAPAERTAMNEILSLLQTLPPEQVILTEHSFAPRLTVFTSHYPYAFYEAYMYLAPDAELISRAEIYNTLVPDEALTPRGVFGTRYQNQILYERVLCRIGNLVKSEKQDCSAITVECPACDRVEHPRAFTEEEIVKTLNDAHVTYVFLKKVPDILRPYLQPAGTAGGRILYHFSVSR